MSENRPELSNVQNRLLSALYPARTVYESVVAAYYADSTFHTARLHEYMADLAYALGYKLVPIEEAAGE